VTLLDRFLDDVALHHLIDALCKLSSEAMDVAYANKVRLTWFYDMSISDSVSLPLVICETHDVNAGMVSTCKNLFAFTCHFARKKMWFSHWL